MVGLVRVNLLISASGPSRLYVFVSEELHCVNVQLARESKRVYTPVSCLALTYVCLEWFMRIRRGTTHAKVGCLASVWH